MKFNEDLAAIHAYLCADGCVIRNPPTQKSKYYKIDLRNTNIVLLKDFQERFYKYFGLKPNLYPGQRCQIGSKKIYLILAKEFGSFYSREWRMPNLKEKLSKVWLRTFFDCEGWVFCKTHQNRHIGVDSVNEQGLNQVKKSIENLKIKVIKKVIKNRKMFRLLIYGKENLIRFQQEIGFIHPIKKETLEKTIDDFVEYDWNVTKEKNKLKTIMLEKARIKKPYLVRIISKEEDNLKKLSKFLNSVYSINSIKIHKMINGLGTPYFELSINKRDEIKKLTKHNLINTQELDKIDKTRFNNSI